VAAFIDILPHIMIDEEKIKNNLSFMCNLISQNLQVDNEFIQKALWQHGLPFILRHLQTYTVKNDIQQKLIENIKNLGFYIGPVFYSHLVIVLSLIKQDKSFD
jgi:hypothetical protein